MGAAAAWPAGAGTALWKRDQLAGTSKPPMITAFDSAAACRLDGAKLNDHGLVAVPLALDDICRRAADNHCPASGVDGRYGGLRVCAHGPPVVYLLSEDGVSLRHEISLRVDGPLAQARPLLHPERCLSTTGLLPCACQENGALELSDLKKALEGTTMSKPEFVYPTYYIRTTPERLWQGLTERD